MSVQTDIYVAKESFSVNLDGVNVVVNKGQTRVRAGHPIMKGREMYFEPLTVHYDIESATAKPGEKRGESKPDPEPEPKADPKPESKPDPKPEPEPETTRSKGLTTDSIKPKTAADK